ncbi:PREDICTED: uncharacterized protein LOC106790827 [Polistes canadensis]|uniref:uncharacterized protein LOC106790827 n=1 Tax=Polistes canadensis TaxID=91411 RepID=UPI000718DF84|nr:PREDICTED: uncharacterized protein LOC106790827 [Polistes canadensis]KAI4493404.1 hypothetical protein M0804_001580 [Polistes exclamans]
MASAKDSSAFFTRGTANQFEHVLKLYPQALRLKAERKTKKPEELIKLDNWYQNELPKRIKSRGKDAHLNHEELVHAMKWKQARGKYYPQLSYLIKVNTPRAVMAETRKAFKKLPNLEQAITALSNLKGVGTTMASALLAAASPECAPFMADECLMAIPEIEGIDYTTKEYLKFVQHIQTTVDRLNKQTSNGKSWSPHRVEMALWTHYVASELKPELLEGIPGSTENGNSHPSSNGEATEPSDDSNQEGAVVVVANGKEPGSIDPAAIDENSTTTSFTEDSMDKPATPITVAVPSEDTNDSLATNENDDSNNTPRLTDSEDTEDSQDVQEPPTKKSKK